MRHLSLSSFLLALSITVAACGSDSTSSTTSTSSSASTAVSTTTGTGSAGAGGAGTGGAGTGGGTTGTGGAHADKSANCASTFGDALTNAYGRIDGTVLAVVKPVDMQCPMPNSDHLVLEVTMSGAVYRMVVNLQSTSGDPNVFFQSLSHALPAPAWSEGWHTGLTLDYVTDLGVHTDATFTAYPLAPLADLVTDAITVGQKISVYATSTGGASAHLVHRNGSGHDGAIVVDLDGSPKMMIFHFADQSF